MLSGGGGGRCVGLGEQGGLGLLGLRADPAAMPCCVHDLEFGLKLRHGGLEWDDCHWLVTVLSRV
jgi:hypothetical protein